MIKSASLMAEFPPGLGVSFCQNQPSYCAADSLPIRKSGSASGGKEMGLSEGICGDTAFASLHPGMEGLATSSQLEHEPCFTSQSSCTKEEKKISLHDSVLGTEYFLKVHVRATLLYGSLPGQKARMF